MSNTKEKFVVTRDEFLAPYRLRAAMDEMVVEELRAQGKSEDEISDHLRLINEEGED